MNNKKFTLCCAIGFVIILFFLQHAMSRKLQITSESFTPRIREMYRPYIRDTRILSEGFLGDQGNGVLTLLKKFDFY